MNKKVSIILMALCLTLAACGQGGGAAGRTGKSTCGSMMNGQSVNNIVYR